MCVCVSLLPGTSCWACTLWSCWRWAARLWQTRWDSRNSPPTESPSPCPGPSVCLWCLCSPVQTHTHTQWMNKPCRLHKGRRKVSRGDGVGYRVGEEVYGLAEGFGVGAGDHPPEQLFALTVPGPHVQHHAPLLRWPTEPDRTAGGKRSVLFPTCALLAW